jgi:hypothetical protein
MSDSHPFDKPAAHKYFSADNFNKTWDYIEKSNRSPEEDLQMLHTAIASLWHWTQRDDATDENLSVGHWQVSRVYNLIKQPNNARTYGLLSLKYAGDLTPFLKGYAYETLARSEMQAGNRVAMYYYLDKAREMAQQITLEEDRRLLLKDLGSIK